MLHEWPSIFESFVLNAEKRHVQVLPAALMAHRIDFASEYYLSPAFPTNLIGVNKSHPSRFSLAFRGHAGKSLLWKQLFCGAVQVSP